MYNPHRNLLASLEDHPLTEIQLRLNPFQLILLRDSAAGDIKQREQGEKEATFRFFPSRCKNHLSPLSPYRQMGNQKRDELTENCALLFFVQVSSPVQRKTR